MSLLITLAGLRRPRAVKVAIALYVLHVGTLAIKGGATGSPDPARR